MKDDEAADGLQVAVLGMDAQVTEAADGLVEKIGDGLGGSAVRGLGYVTAENAALRLLAFPE